MRILQIAPCFYPAWKYGGTVPSVYNLSRRLVRNGHEVVVYTTDTIDKDTRQKEKCVELEGIRVHYFRNISNRLAWHKLFFAPDMIPNLKRRVKDFDLVHLQDYRISHNIFAYHYIMKFGIPYVLQPRDALMTLYQKRGLKQTFDKVLGYKMFRNAAMVIAEKPSEAKQYEDMGICQDRIRIIPSGVDLDGFDNLPQRGQFREKYHLDEMQKLILYLGRIERVKGLSLLVEAFAELVRELNNAVLVIAGPDTGFLSEVKELIKDHSIGQRVLFTGALLGKNKLEAYVDADVYVMPSWYEACSITPLEAYACGTPVITTDLCGTAEWMVNKFERVVPYNSERLCEAIAEILNPENSGNRSKEQATRLSLVRERFSWSVVAEMIEDIYLHVLDSANPYNGER